MSQQVISAHRAAARGLRIACAALLGAAAALTIHALPSAAAVTDPASVVNTLLGTSNGGNTFPGADVPFGMVQWSPDTSSRPQGGGYSYNDSTITGFPLTHISGPGCDGGSDLPILPTVGAVSATATTTHSHAPATAPTRRPGPCLVTAACRRSASAWMCTTAAPATAPRSSCGRATGPGPSAGPMTPAPTIW